MHQKIKFIPMKIHKTVTTRAAPSGPDMHQIVCRLGLRPRPHWGAYSAPPDPLAGLRGPTSKGRGRKGDGRGEGRGKGREGEGPTSRGREGALLLRGGEGERRGGKGADEGRGGEGNGHY